LSNFATVALSHESQLLRHHSCVVFFIVSACLFPGRGFAQTKEVDFQRDVRPILAEHCTHVTARTQLPDKPDCVWICAMPRSVEGNRRSAIVPGKPDESAMIVRVSSHNADEIMPPPKENKPLKGAQIETLKQWIQQGAKYSTHWAFDSPQKVPLPRRERLIRWTPSWRQSCNRWICDLRPRNFRRALSETLSDLVGLPPSPAS